ncbi:MAG: hypothetical protein V3S46_07225, partial [Nitrospinota bacterium]
MSNKKSPIPSSLDFYYIKTEQYRVFHVDGMFGGVSPSGKIFADLFVQKIPLPQIMKHKIAVDGKVGEEVKNKRVGKEGVVRVVEAGLIMDIDTAISFRDWLSAKINIVRKGPV